MAIGDDFTIDYTDKTIRHTSGTSVYNMYELYAWVMDEIDESGTIDDTVPMTAQTPTAYTMTNGWFIDYTSTQYLKNGSLQTSGWEDDIRMISYNANTTSFAAADIGETITGATTGDTGTVLFYDERYGTNLGVVWIRMDDSGDLFDNATEDFAVSGGGSADGLFTTTFSSGSVTGETVWANIYTLGTLQSNTTLYLLQDGSEVTQWWTSGQIDVLLAIKEGGVEIDEGYVCILARQYSKLYDHYIADLTSGARTPIPIATFDDGNNESGYRQMVLSVTNDGFTEGDLIRDDSDATIEGVVTSYDSGTNTLQYYLVDSLTDFSAATGTFASVSPGTGTGTAVNSTSVGPAVTSGVTITFTSSEQDINNGNGDRPYDVTINCNSNTVADIYEYLKYVTRRGSTTTFSGTGHSEEGGQYVAVGEQYLTYESMSGTFTAGNTVTGGTSGATAVIVSDHTTETALVVTNITGEFEEGETITEGAASADISTDGIEDISPSKQSPFGTFAGGKFFGARGVWLSSVASADASSYELIDSTNTTQAPPQTISITVNSVESGDRVGVFKATGDNNTVDKSQYNIDASHGSGVSYIRIEESIPADTPSTGTLRVVRRDGSGVIIDEQRYAYTAFDNDDQPSYSEFTLSGTTSVAYDTDDTVYVPYLDEEASGTSVTTSVTYVSDRYVTSRVRKKLYLPFITKGQITSSGLTVTAIKTEDSAAV